MDGVYKVVIIGPESTGKSTLSAALATYYNTVYNPEYAREYLNGIAREYNEADLLTIAQGQIRTEDECLKRGRKYVFCDTDLYVIKVWSEAKYGRCHRKILEQIAIRQYDMYLLTDIDMPWQDDPLREHPDPSDRQYFFDQYKDIVIESGVPFTIVSGSEEERLYQAMTAIGGLE